MAGPWEQYAGATQPATEPAPEAAVGPWTQYGGPGASGNLQSSPIAEAPAPAAATGAAPAPDEEPGVLDKVSNFFTGADRETRATRELPELQSSGVLSGSGISALKGAQIAATLATTLDPEEAAKILREASPDIGVQQDEKGNWLVSNNKTGVRAVVNKPGFSGMDALQMAGTAALYTPAARAAGILGKGALRAATALGGAAALTETGIQAGQAATGGTFDTGDVALAGLAGVGGELVARGAAAGGNAARTAIAGRGEQAARLRGYFDAAIGAGENPAAAAQRLVGDIVPSTPEAAAQAVVDASNASSRQQMPTIERLAAEVQPNQEILDAAGRLGVADQLIPSQYSGSQAYREIEQGLASIPGSQLNVQQKEAYSALAQQADDLITRYGGTTDKSGLSDRFKQQGLNTIEDLGSKSDALYSQVSAAIPATTQTVPTSTLEYLGGKVADLGDRSLLSSAERRTLGALSRTDDAGNPVAPTYAALDLIRKEVGNGLRGAGRFKDTETGALRRLYSTLSDDQQRTAEEMGVGQLFSSAKALVAQRKQVEDGLTQVLGKDLGGALATSFGNSVKQLGNGNFKDFDRIIGQIPENMRQEAVLTALNDVFTAGSRAEKQMSAPGFVDWYGALSRNDAARQRLQKNLPIGASQQLHDIYTVAKGMRDASKERITTGRITALLDNFADDNGMLGKLWDVGKKVGAAEGVTSGLGIPGAGTVGVLASTLGRQKTPIAEAAGNLLASPRFRETVNAHVRAGGSAAANIAAQEKRLMRTPVYQKWAAALGDDAKARVAAIGPLAYLTTSPAAATPAVELPATAATP